MNNFDDGSDVNVVGGRVSVLTKEKTTPLEKGQFLSMKAGDPESVTIDRSPVNDEFDQWVSGRIDTVVTASNAALQYSNSYSYTSGFGDLYTYGSWFPVSGYGYCWRPYGVGFGWSPFDYGSWYFDPAFGWTFLGSQPWGWLPYHYGGWIFRPGFGWVWSPGNTFWGTGRPGWRPVTGVFVRSGGALGLVPSHPMDSGRKTPINMEQGVFPVTQRGIAGSQAVAAGENWKIEKRPSGNILPGRLASAGVPARLSRTMTADGTASPNTILSGRDSSIVYDPASRRFINANNGTPRSEQIREGIARTVSPTAVAPVGAGKVAPVGAGTVAPVGAGTVAPVGAGTVSPVGAGKVTPPVRTVTPPRATVATPPPVPRATVMERNSGGGWGGPSASRGSGSSGGRSSGSSGGSTRPSGGGSSRSGGSGGARPAPSSGGRPH